MSDIILRDIDAVLMGRIKRVADAHGWSLQVALMQVLEQGLYVCEGELSRSFDDADARALQEAIAAMEQVPSDPGFAKIGRVEPPPPPPKAPDQTVSLPRGLFDEASSKVDD
ncbi:hypothetical protein [Marilutibacter chinensis]|uniref:Uncharacterized protein n=1 Tax=Marilutibacter chinensis TaxID=2912247 RepID=A0ABS9HXA2_9GAMM|nr:hypothetical protein [Lysobacter chinensis]MCF7222800.1 hypothetical protein [Lysobacter chinensis]